MVKKLPSKKNTELYTAVIETTGKYGERLAEEAGLKAHNITSIMFGVPGSGKSTFVARLASTKSAKEFNEEILHRDTTLDGDIIVEGIKIGAGLKSTTLFPQKHVINDIGIYDMAGYKDNDEDLCTIIGVGHKIHMSFLNVRGGFIILVLINAGYFKDGRLHSFIDGYHKEFIEKFGKDPRTLNNTYFIINHLDDNPDMIDKLTEHLYRRTFDASALGDGILNQFMHRLTTKHITIDYRTDGQTECYRKFAKMIGIGDDGRLRPVEGIVGGGISTMSFDVYDSLLCTKLNKDIEEYLKSIDDDYKISSDTIKKLRTDIDLDIKKCDDIAKSIMSKHGEIEAITASRGEFVQSLRRFALEKKRCESEINELQKEYEHTKNIYATYERSAKDIMVTTVQVFVSHTHNKLSNTLIPQTIRTQRIELMLDLVGQKIVDTVAIVVNLGKELNDESIRRYVDNGGKLVPTDYRKMKKYMPEGVLYNTGVGDKTRFNEVKCDTVGVTGHMHIIFDRNEPFKYYHYTVQMLCDTAEYTAIGASYTSKLLSIESSLVELSNTIRKCIDDTEKIKATDSLTSGKLEQLEKDIGEMKLNLGQRVSETRKKVSDVKSELAKKLSEWSTYKNDSVYKYGERIRDIFIQYNLKNTVGDTLKGSDTTIRSFINDYSVIQKLMPEVDKKLAVFDKSEQKD